MIYGRVNDFKFIEEASLEKVCTLLVYLQFLMNLPQWNNNFTAFGGLSLWSYCFVEGNFTALEDWTYEFTTF